MTTQEWANGKRDSSCPFQSTAPIGAVGPELLQRWVPDMRAANVDLPKTFTVTYNSACLTSLTVTTFSGQISLLGNASKSDASSSFSMSTRERVTAAKICNNTVRPVFNV